MTNDLLRARDRLLSPDELRFVAALLNMPPLHDDHATPSEQRRALYARIADWTRLAAQAAGRPGAPDATAARRRFAYLVEYSGPHLDGWLHLPGADTEGLTLSPDAPQAVAASLLGHHVARLAGRCPDPARAPALRVCVWDLEITGEPRAPRQSDLSEHARTLKAHGVPPHAVQALTRPGYAESSPEIAAAEENSRFIPSST